MEISESTPKKTTENSQNITYDEAANLLNVSYQYVVQLIDNNRIPFQIVDNKKIITRQDVLAYQKIKKLYSIQAINELTSFLQEEGFYD